MVRENDLNAKKRSLVKDSMMNFIHELLKMCMKTDTEGKRLSLDSN